MKDRLHLTDATHVLANIAVPSALALVAFPPAAFVEDAEQGKVTCPGDQASQSRFRDNQKNTTKCRFAAATCRCCPLVNRCMKNSTNIKRLVRLLYAPTEAEPCQT